MLSRREGLVVCAVAAPVEPLPWIRIVTVGRWEGHSYGTFTLTAADLVSMVEEFQRAARDKVVDYQHATLRVSEAGEKAPAAGWMKALEVRGDALWARVEWTQTADRELREQRFRYFSPVIEFKAKDKVTGRVWPCRLHSGGLTNQPFFDHLGGVAASESRNMSKHLLFASLGLIACRELGLEPDDPTVALKLKERLGDGKANTETADALLARGVAEGKVVPATETWFKELAASEPAKAAEFIKNAPRVVPLAQAANTTTANAVALTEEERSLGKRMGLSEDELRKAKGES